MLLRVVLWTTLLTCASACILNENVNQTHCASLKELEISEAHPEWTIIIVANLGTQAYTTVKKETFVNVPNVDQLHIYGAVNKVDSEAFNKLGKLRHLQLQSDVINIIAPETLANPAMKLLRIYNCAVKDIRPGVFEKLPVLEEIDVDGNYLPIIEEGIFTNTHLRKIILRRDKIHTVKPNAFGNMPNLRWLSLEENELTTIEPQFALGFTPTLNDLYINRNKLTKVTRDMFSVMPNLDVLLVNLNQIKRFGDYVFSDLKNMSLLDISNNRLEELQPNVFNVDGMPKLHLLFLHDNQLTFLSTGVLVRLPVLERMSTGGNPWQCPCWEMLNSYMKNHNITHLCYEIYTRGERPFCVTSDKHKSDCIYDIGSVKDIPQIFVDSLKEYPHVPPVCNIFGADQPFLGA